MNMPAIQSPRRAAKSARLANLSRALGTLVWRGILITGFLFGALTAALLLSALLKACGILTNAEPDALLAGCLLALTALDVLGVVTCAALLNASLERGAA